MKLLGVGSNAKTVKGDGAEYFTAILYLAPDRNHTIATSKKTLCPSATPGCSSACLYTAGRGRFDSVKSARIRRANLFIADQKRFLQQLKTEVGSHVNRCEKIGAKPVVRLNGTSDIVWESLKYSWSGVPEHKDKNLMECFPQVQFYDYTKILPRLSRELPSNYHLTFSRSEKTRDSTIQKIVRNGGNVSVVFDEIPEEYLGIPVIDGDVNDLRFLDPQGVIVGLSAKGDAKKDSSGFVVKA